MDEDGTGAYSRLSLLLSNMHYHKHHQSQTATHLVKEPDVKPDTLSMPTHMPTHRKGNVILKFSIFLNTRTKTMGKPLWLWGHGTKKSMLNGLRKTRLEHIIFKTTAPRQSGKDYLPLILKILIN